MLMSDPTIFLENQEISSSRKTEATTIRQLIQYNARKKYLNSSTTAPKTEQILRHHLERKTPVAIYIALKVHGKIHFKETVDKLHNYGLCISYDCLLQISKDLENTVISMFETEGAPTPPQLTSYAGYHWRLWQQSQEQRFSGFSTWFHGHAGTATNTMEECQPVLCTPQSNQAW